LSSPYLGGSSVTDDDARFVTTYRLPLCPDFQFVEFPADDALFKPTHDRVTPTAPYVFWLNDDDDKHDDETDGNDVPGTKSSFWGMNWIGDYNYESPGIDGTRDLIDFFPIAINVHDFFTLVPESQNYTFTLKHEDEALNIVYTQMTVDNTDEFLKEVDKNNITPLFGAWQSATQLDGLVTHKVTSDGITLPN
jgi:hypothetical protein